MKNKILVIVIFILFFNSCKSTTQLAKQNTSLDQEIIVLNINQDAPIDSKILKEIKLGYGLLYKNCPKKWGDFKIIKFFMLQKN